MVNVEKLWEIVGEDWVITKMGTDVGLYGGCRMRACAA